MCSLSVDKNVCECSTVQLLALKVSGARLFKQHLNTGEPVSAVLVTRHFHPVSCFLCRDTFLRNLAATQWEKRRRSKHQDTPSSSDDINTPHPQPAEDNGDLIESSRNSCSMTEGSEGWVYSVWIRF